PALEPGVGADVGQPQRLALAEDDAQHAVLARQRADRLAPPLRDAVHHELRERAAVVGHAERRVPGARERAYRAHDDLEHIADRQFPGHGEHRRADPAEDLVLAGRITGSRAGGARSRRRRGTRAHSGRAGGAPAGRGAVLAHDTTLPARAPPPSVAAMTHTHADNGAGQAHTPGTTRAARVAVVTGASRGLGRAIARALAEDGYRLVVDARDGAALGAAMAGLPAGAVVTAIAGDITDPAHRSDLRRAAEALGGADLLINNAGTLGPSPLPAVSDFPLGELRTAFEVNVIAPVALTQMLLP